MEKTNARYITGFDDLIELVVVDASFISLQTLLPVIKNWFVDQQGTVVALIKPQFEAGRSETARGSGVIRDPLIHKAVLEKTLTFAQTTGFQVMGLIRSPLIGPKGNIEFLVHLTLPKGEDQDINAMVQALFPEPFQDQGTPPGP